jgi:hypothetical protein
MSKKEKDKQEENTNGTGKTTKYSVDEIIEAVRSSYGLLTAAAESLGCPRSTIQRRAEKSKKIQEAIEEEREKLGDLAEGGLFLLIQSRKEWALKFYLKTQCRDRGYYEKQEIKHIGKQDLIIDKKLPDFSNWETEDIAKYNNSLKDALTYVEKYKRTPEIDGKE